MKKTFLFIAACIIFLSCKKEDGSTTPPDQATTDYLSYVEEYDSVSHYKTVNRFLYDENNNLASFRLYLDYNDSFYGECIDSIVYTFSINTSSHLPDSYTYEYFRGTNGRYDNYDTVFRTHKLYYDLNNRVTKDSIINYGERAINYTYGPDKIFLSEHLTGENENNATITLSNGNIISIVNDSNNDSLPTFSYYDYANPAYNEKISYTMGLLLYGLELGDHGTDIEFVSKNFLNTYSGETVTHNVVTLDSKGRIVKSYDTSAPSRITTYYYR